MFHLFINLHRRQEGKEDTTKIVRQPYVFVINYFVVMVPPVPSLEIDYNHKFLRARKRLIVSAQFSVSLHPVLDTDELHARCPSRLLIATLCTVE